VTAKGNRFVESKMRAVVVGDDPFLSSSFVKTTCTFWQNTGGKAKIFHDMDVWEF